MTMRHAAGGAGPIDEPERGKDEEVVEDPAGRPEPYVKGPTGPAPLASELRGDPGAGEDDNDVPPGEREDATRARARG